MGLFSFLSGGGSDSPQQTPVNTQTTNTVGSTPNLTESPSTTPTDTASHFDMTSSPEVQHPAAQQEEPLRVSDLFATAKLSTDRSLQSLPGVDKKTVEYLLLDEQAPNALPGSQPGALPSRGWSDDLCYGTGTMYLMALSTGGLWGVLEGMRHPESKTFKLRLNGILNACTRRGPFLGNTAGVVTMLYNCTNALIGSARGKHDVFNSLGAAAISGALFKSTQGIKPAAITSVMCLTVAGLWNWNQAKIQEFRRSVVRKAGIGFYH
ncbi:Mitochondrial import inner membrane translocase subunit tim23 [Dispira simplex]|nr:Mitochondrial import inner membrane translocase subunit tim23 [Dispira simplex]